jgi:hypothetical protein
MRTPLIACLALTALVAGCGGAKVGPNSNEKRAEAVDCMQQKYGLDARMVGDDTIQVGDAGTGPRVRFFLTRGQAEGAQFEGTAEGALQSGAALIYVRRNGDDLLEKVEDCIDSL